MKSTQNNLKELKVSQETAQKNKEARIKNLEIQIGHLSTKISATPREGFVDMIIPRMRSAKW